MTTSYQSRQLLRRAALSTAMLLIAAPIAVAGPPGYLFQNFQPAGMTWWQQLLLAAVFVTDLLVFLDLVHAELRGWRPQHHRTVPPSAAGLPSVSG